MFANIWVSKAALLNQRLQQQTGVNPNVPSQMRGYYLEPAFHLLPRRFRHDIIASTRYERHNTQQEMPAGYLPWLQFNRWSWVTGLTYKPVPDVAVKLDYVFNRNRSSVVMPLDGVNLGAATIDQAIRKHESEGRLSTERYWSATGMERLALLAFLKSL